MFLRDLELFLYRGRTPKTARMKPAAGGRSTHLKKIRCWFVGRNGRRIIRVPKRALLAMCYCIDVMDSYDALKKVGKVKMSYELCRKWKKARWKYNKFFDWPDGRTVG